MSEAFRSLIILFILIFALSYAENTGLLCAFTRFIIFRSNLKYIFHMTALASVISGASGNGGARFAVMMCAAVFKSLGADPRVGVIMGYAAAAFGRYVCILISPADVFLILPSNILRSFNGLSILSIIQLLPFTGLASVVFVFALVYISGHIVSPFIKVFFPGPRVKADVSFLSSVALTPKEKRGLLFAAAALAFQTILCIFVFFLYPDLFAGLLPYSLFFIFFLTSVLYGIGSGTITDVRVFLYYVRLAISLNCVSPGIIFLIIAAPFSIPYPISSNLLFRFVIMIADMLCPFSRSFKFALSMFNFYNTGVCKKATAKDMLFMLLPYALTIIVLFAVAFAVHSLYSP